VVGPSADDGPSNDGHYMAILPDNIRSHPDGYPALRQSLARIEQESEEDADISLNNLFHKHFGYSDIHFQQVAIHNSNEPCNSVEEGRLFTEVIYHAVNTMARTMQHITNRLYLWAHKFEEAGVHLFRENASEQGGEDGDIDADARPLFQPRVIASSAHSLESYLTSFTKDAGKGTSIVWWDASFGQLRWVHSTSGNKRIAFERLGRFVNIFPNYVEVDGVITRVGNRNRPVTTHMAHRRLTGNKTEYLFILAVYITKTANPRINMVVVWWTPDPNDSLNPWANPRVEFWGDDCLTRLDSLEPVPEVRPPSSELQDNLYNVWLDENESKPMTNRMSKLPRRFKLETAERDPVDGSATIETMSGTRLHGAKCLTTQSDYVSLLHSNRELARPPSAEELASQPCQRPSPVVMTDRLQTRRETLNEQRRLREVEKAKKAEVERLASEAQLKQREERKRLKEAEAKAEAEAQANVANKRRRKTTKRCSLPVSSGLSISSSSNNSDFTRVQRQISNINSVSGRNGLVEVAPTRTSGLIQYQQQADEYPDDNYDGEYEYTFPSDPNISTRPQTTINRSKSNQSSGRGDIHNYRDTHDNRGYQRFLADAGSADAGGGKDRHSYRSDSHNNHNNRNNHDRRVGSAGVDDGEDHRPYRSDSRNYRDHHDNRVGGVEDRHSYRSDSRSNRNNPSNHDNYDHHVSGADGGGSGEYHRPYRSDSRNYCDHRDNRVGGEDHRRYYSDSHGNRDNHDQRVGGPGGEDRRRYHNDSRNNRETRNSRNNRDHRLGGGGDDHRRYRSDSSNYDSNGGSGDDRRRYRYEGHRGNTDDRRRRRRHRSTSSDDDDDHLSRSRLRRLRRQRLRDGELERSRQFERDRADLYFTMSKFYPYNK
jgi:hypothetical protein